MSTFHIGAQFFLISHIPAALLRVTAIGGASAGVSLE